MPESFGGITKIVKWDPEKRVGSFKHQNKYYAFQLDADTPVRVDEAIPVSRWQRLNEVATTTWCLAEKSFYESPQRAVGRIKPRLIVCAGYGIEPLPNGERRFPGIIGILGWHTATDMDWKQTGTGSVNNEVFDMGFSPNELVMFGKRGNPDDLRKGLSIHVMGPVEDSHPLSSSGKVLSREEAQDIRGKVLNAPLIRAQRLVVLNKAFEKDYPLCFEETFMSGAKD